jgi:hypothetical protein
MLKKDGSLLDLNPMKLPQTDTFDTLLFVGPPGEALERSKKGAQTPWNLSIRHWQKLATHIPFIPH